MITSRSGLGGTTTSTVNGVTTVTNDGYTPTLKPINEILHSLFSFSQSGFGGFPLPIGWMFVGGAVLVYMIFSSGSKR